MDLRRTLKIKLAGYGVKLDLEDKGRTYKFLVSKISH